MNGVTYRVRGARIAERAMRRFGQAATDELRRAVNGSSLRIHADWKQHAPVARDRYRASIGIQEFGGGMAARIGTNVVYAQALEEGSGLYGPKHAKYEIRPKHGKALAFAKNFGQGGVALYRTKTGKITQRKASARKVIVKRVMHPGIKGGHYGRNAYERERPRFLAALPEAIRAAITKGGAT